MRNAGLFWGIWGNILKLNGIFEFLPFGMRCPVGCGNGGRMMQGNNMNKHKQIRAMNRPPDIRH
jgi:hypothetical protein